MKIGERGQVTITKEIRDQFGLGPETEVDIKVVGGAIVIQKSASAPQSRQMERPLRMAGPSQSATSSTSELSVHFETRKACDAFLHAHQIRVHALAREALFLASRLGERTA
jgi:AbrB family looped-hinge helix DNA binding protein